MSIMIKDIDMPINCTRCPCSDDETRFCRAANKYIPMLGKPNFCPLMEAEERKTGKWIPHKSIFGGLGELVYTCNQCGYNIGFHMEKFCPDCGCHMLQEGEDNGQAN